MAEASLATEPDWLIERRRKGASLVSELALPTAKQKGWEFTDLSGLEIATFEPVDSTIEGLEPREGDGGGPVVMPLAEAASRLPQVVRENLGSLVGEADPFVARNDAAWRDGVLVWVPRGQRLEAPLRLEVTAGSGGASAWRALIVLEEGAEAEVWERYAGEAPGAGGNGGGAQGEGLFNAVVELVVGDGANLRYVCQQELSERSWVFATQRAEVGRDASLEWVALGFGSAQGKVRMETRLAGRGSSAKVTGAYAGTGTQHLDYDTTQEHAAEDTTSDLSFRGVLGDHATAVWRGMIRVDPGAQRTDAFQDCRNLLLARTAHADAIPGLEIEADDVRCTHAAAVAQVDAEQLFYLRGRGLADAQARRLVIEGFLQALVERTTEGPIRDTLAEALERRLEHLLAAA